MAKNRKRKRRDRKRQGDLKDRGRGRTGHKIYLTGAAQSC